MGPFGPKLPHQTIACLDCPKLAVTALSKFRCSYGSSSKNMLIEPKLAKHAFSLNEPRTIAKSARITKNHVNQRLHFIGST